MKIYTIGVYGSSEKSFFNKLIENKIELFCDIRQRRGVRGSEYVFVNSKRLQEKLKEIGVYYLHVLDLAPTTEIRKLQQEADFELGAKKRDRYHLGQVFSTEYDSKILQKFNFESLIERFKEDKISRVAFFCVETYPEACHRYLVAREINRLFDIEIIHL